VVTAWRNGIKVADAQSGHFIVMLGKTPWPGGVLNKQSDPVTVTPGEPVDTPPSSDSPSDLIDDPCRDQFLDWYEKQTRANVPLWIRYLACGLNLEPGCVLTAKTEYAADVVAAKRAREAYERCMKEHKGNNPTVPTPEVPPRTIAPNPLPGEVPDAPAPHCLTEALTANDPPSSPTEAQCTEWLTGVRDRATACCVRRNPVDAIARANCIAEVDAGSRDLRCTPVRAGL
jgi:hypothetical protein